MQEYAPEDATARLVSVEEMFFLMASGRQHQQHEAYPFSFFDFVQCGCDNSTAKDDFIYVYAPEGAHSHLLMLARVHKWISDDGQKMILVWSDAMKNEEGATHAVNYKWNQMEIQIQLT